MLYALLFLPALLAVAYVVHRRPKVLDAAVESNPFETLDAVLAELEAAALELERVA